MSSLNFGKVWTDNIRLDRQQTESAAYDTYEPNMKYAQVGSTTRGPVFYWVCSTRNFLIVCSIDDFSIFIEIPMADIDFMSPISVMCESKSGFESELELFGLDSDPDSDSELKCKNPDSDS